MGLFSGFRRLKLTTHDRKLIWQAFGSSLTNKLFTNNTATLLDEGYERNIDVYSVIKRISDVYSALPYEVVEIKKDGTEEVLNDTSLNELLQKPNRAKGYSMTDIDEQTIIYLLATGNTFMVGNTQIDRTLIEEIDILPSQYVTIKTNGNFFIPSAKYDFTLGTSNKTFEQDQVSNIRLFNPNYSSLSDSFRGLSIIQVAARAVQASNDRWDADSNILQNRGVSGLLVADGGSDRTMTAEEAQAIQDKFNQDTAGSHNFGKIKVTSANAKYIQMGMSSTDLQLLEKGVINLRSICNVLGLDSSLFNDPANKKFSNLKEGQKDLFINAIKPISSRIGQAHTQFLAKNHFPNRNVIIRKDFNQVEALQADKKTEAEKDKIVIDGINTVLNMPISNIGKAELLKEMYDLTDELTEIILKDEQIQTVSD